MIENYQELLKEIMDDRIEFILDNLPNFREHFMVVNQHGEAIYVDLEDICRDNDMSTLSDYVKKTAYSYSAIGVVYAMHSTVVDVGEDDPYYEDYKDGILDIDSIPSSMKKESISVYSEVLGPHRKNAIISLDENHTATSSSITFSDPKMWPWFPLIHMNGRVN